MRSFLFNSEIKLGRCTHNLRILTHYYNLLYLGNFKMCVEKIEAQYTCYTFVYNFLFYMFFTAINTCTVTPEVPASLHVNFFHSIFHSIQNP
jgi:hypothetical protein